jgi:hypothetical protein
MKKPLFIFALLISIHISAFSQETFIHNYGQVQITLPENWFYALNEDGSMTVYAPNKEMTVNVHVLEAKDLDSAFKELESDLQRRFKDTKLETPVELDLNGMHALSIKGQAQDGKISLIYTILITKTNRILAIGAPSKVEFSKKYETQLSEFIQSIKPVEKEKEKDKP